MRWTGCIGFDDIDDKLVTGLGHVERMDYEKSCSDARNAIDDDAEMCNADSDDIVVYGTEMSCSVDRTYIDDGSWDMAISTLAPMGRNDDGSGYGWTEDMVISTLAPMSRKWAKTGVKDGSGLYMTVSFGDIDDGPGSRMDKDGRRRQIWVLQHGLYDNIDVDSDGSKTGEGWRWWRI